MDSSVTSTRSVRRFKSFTQEELESFKKEVDYDDHIISLEELSDRYDTDIENGHSHQRAEEYLNTLGPNTLTPPKVIPKWRSFAKHLYKGFALMLWAAIFLCLVVYIVEVRHFRDHSPEHLYLAMILLLVIFLTSAFTYYQERKTTKVMEAFRNMQPLFTTVIRQGQKTVIPVEDVVLGDLVVLSTGDRIPADIRIIEAEGLKVDNSCLTGESEPQTRIPKFTHPNPMATMNLAFFSTQVCEGVGKGIVIASGDCTFVGRIAGLASGLEEDMTPIAKEIKRFIKLLAVIAIVVGLFTFTLAVSVGYTVVDALIFLLAIVIATVPEGMLVTFTMCLTISAYRLAEKKCLVKNMEAVETLGSTSTICTDKTGTLTLQRMTVSHIWINQTILDTNITDQGGMSEEIDFEDATFRAFWLIGALCSRAEFMPGQENVMIQSRKVIGDASEAAILKFVEMTLGNTTEIRKNNIKVCEIPFSSKRKYQISVHRTFSEDEVQYLVVMKGAPERIVQRCKTFMLNDEEIDFNETISRSIFDACYTLAQMGERVIAFCDKMLPKKSFPENYEFSSETVNFPTNDMRFVGLISMIDPPRSSVPEAVAKCRSAGIKVVMVTGDHPATAKAIAKLVGIISEQNETVDEVARRLKIKMSEVDIMQVKAAVITGDSLRLMSKQDLDEVLRIHSEIVFARTSPTQKLFIVEGCQRLGDIVAVTGDGVNDSPAMKQANIGIAMGIAGTDVAKLSADMILMDDDFSTIVVGVEEGRRIFDNLKKSVAFTLTANTPEVVPFLVSVGFGIPLPLGVIAILCINYLTDIWPAISLVYEKAESDIMQREPRNPNYDKLVNSRMLGMTYLQIGGLQTCAGFFSYFVIMAEHGFMPNDLFGIRERWDSKVVNDLEDSFGQEWTYEQRKRLEYTCHTAFFASMLIVQMADLIICKTRRNSLLKQGMSNWPLNWGIIVQTALAVIIIYTPGVNTILHFYPLKFRWWMLSFPFFFLIIIYDETRRYLIRKYPGGWVERETYY